MEIKGFAPETVETVHAEETNDVAAAGAIDVSEKSTETGVVAFTEKIIMPVIPDTLVINGVKINETELRKKVSEAKKMVIKDLNDIEGLKKAEETLKEFSKTRTGSETWRTKTVMPSVNKFGKDLKKRIDTFAEICQDGEDYLTKIITPIKKAAELALQKQEEAKDLLAVERAAELVKLGGVFDGQGTYNFPYDADLFVLQESLRELAPEAYVVKLDEIQASFEIEQKRLQAIEDAKVNEANALKGKVEDLNAERTEMRVENLELKGFKENAMGLFVNGDVILSYNDIITLDKDQWKELLNPAPVVDNGPGIPMDVSPSGGIRYAPSNSPQGFAQESTSPHVEPDQAPSVGDSIVSDFADFAAATPVEEQPVVEAEKVMTRTLVFSEAKPFVEFAVGDYTMVVFPNEYEAMITFTEEQIAVKGQFNEQLQFKLIENAGA